MKKITVLLLTLCMACLFAACGGSDDQAAKTEQTDPTEQPNQEEQTEQETRHWARHISVFF